MRSVLKLPPESPLVLFAIGRSVGWIGHAMEQYATGQLIRPRAKYVGVPPVQVVDSPNKPTAESDSDSRVSLCARARSINLNEGLRSAIGRIQPPEYACCGGASEKIGNEIQPQC
jgi:hypothetical protein